MSGYGKRAQKAQIETPRKSFEFIKSTTSKQEKQIDSHQPTTLKDKSNVQSKSNDQKQIEELKNKCIDCEKQIDGLKVRVNEKNLALEAFIVVIKQHIKTVMYTILCSGMRVAYKGGYWGYCLLMLGAITSTICVMRVLNTFI